MRVLLTFLLLFSTLNAREIAFFADGVVFESRLLEYYCWRFAFRQMGQDVELEDYKRWIGSSKEELSEIFYDTYGCTWDPEVFHLKASEYALIFAKGITPKPGALDLIGKLKGSIPLTLVTKIPMEQAYIGLEKFGLEYSFNRVTHLRDLYTCEDVLFIVDSGKTAKKLKNLGALVIGVRSELTQDNDFSDCELVVDSLEELTPCLIIEMANGYK